MPNASKAPRARCMGVTAATLLNHGWRRFAELKTPGFCFLGTEYEKPGRSQTCDRAGLAHYVAPLTSLAHCCPNGFPLHADLRAALEFLEKTHNIFPAQKDGEPPRSGFKRASEASDLWRKMMKDACRVKKSASWGPILGPLMEALWKVDVMPSSEAAPARVAAPSSQVVPAVSAASVPIGVPLPAMSVPFVPVVVAHDAADMPNFVDFSDDGECEIVGMSCVCAKVHGQRPSRLLWPGDTIA